MKNRRFLPKTCEHDRFMSSVLLVYFSPVFVGYHLHVHKKNSLSSALEFICHRFHELQVVLRRNAFYGSDIAHCEMESIRPVKSSQSARHLIDTAQRGNGRCCWATGGVEKQARHCGDKAVSDGNA